ncbi:hypothetical protein [Lentzea sp. HUAS12]|uniref:DUF6985 domain-containing protein n=1 Tax=Lentzea sp. HUAS12 TaxID=2951806 RepID=UPI0020A21112|nr:hypothetical protein [Lentzea sp. HUAS12]USX55880.1 hypothetical protein ND450_17820 [Lentzea sp. HUAS12]
MEIPGLGTLTADEYGSLVSAPVPVPVLGGITLPFHVDGYADDPAQQDFHAAVRAFLALDRTALEAAADGVFDYYRHMGEVFGDELDDFPRIAGPADVWDHVTFARHQVTVSRDGGGEPVYVSVEAECGWEEEHGLQVVFRDGARITKVGPYDGHLTNDTDVLYER